MTHSDKSRQNGNAAASDAAATAPETEYPAVVSSNADLRVSEKDEARDAAVTATGADVDNDHADERPVDRSQDAPEDRISEEEDEAEMLQQSGIEAGNIDEHGNPSRDQQFTPVE